MAVTPVPPFAAPPDFPALSDRAAGTYNRKAFDWATALQSATGPNVHAMAVTAQQNAQEAADQAATAVNASAQASAAASVAVSAANFKGEWAALAGALAMPASVRHSGRFWVLLANLADVTAAQPGVSASWAVLDAGTVPSQLLSVAGATVNAVVGVRYLFAANNVTLNAPFAALKGDYHGIRRMAGVTGCSWVWGAIKVRGGTPGTLAVDLQEADLFYEDATWGYI